MLSQNDETAGAPTPAVIEKTEKSSLSLSNNPAPGGRQDPAPEVLSWLDRHAAHLLPGHGGFAWMREGSDTTWNWTDTASLSQVAAAGAMFTTNTRFASKPLPTREEGHDRKGLAPRKFGHLTVDLDGETALADLRELLFEIIPLWGLKPENIAVFLSGKKGFHAVIYDAQLGTEDGDKLLPLIYKRLLHDLKETLPSVDITLACMGQGKQFRLPNITRENGLHKVPLKLDEVREGGLTMEQMREIAKSPRLLPLPKVQPGPEISPIRSRVAEIRRQVWSETGARVRTNLSPEDKASLAEALPACQVVLVGMEDYTGGKGLDFDGMCAKLVASFAAEVGLSVTEALEIYGPWSMDFGGSKTYEDPYERLDILGAKLARPALPWDCRIARAMLPPFDCTGCVMRTREIERAFLDDPLAAMLADLPPMPGPVTSADAPRPPSVRVLTGAQIMAKDYPNRPLIDGLLDEGETLAILAANGLGKSLALVDLALTLADPEAATVWGRFHKTRCLSTLFFQSEVTGKGLQKRLRAMLAAEPRLAPLIDRLAFASFEDSGRIAGNIEDEKVFTAFMHAVEHVRPDVLVIDPLVSYHDRDENSAEMRRALDRITRLQDATGTAVLLAHHVGENSADKTVFKGRGSTAIGDWVANAVLLEWEGKAHEAVRVDHVKSRNFALTPPLWLSRDAGLRLRPCLKPGAKLAEGSEQAVAALVVLGGQVDQQKALVDALRSEHGTSETNAKRWIDEAVASGRIVNTKDGRNTRLTLAEGEW